MMDKTQKRAKMTKEEEVDHISELPEEVRHHILCLLPLTEAIKASLVSRTWRDSWLSLPCLDFGTKFAAQEEPSCIVEQVLARRSGQFDHIESLKFHVPYIGSDFEYHPVNRWIDLAVNKLRVKKLNLSMNFYRLEDISCKWFKWQMSKPDCALMGNTCLKLKLSNGDFVCPVQTRWSALRNLKLTYVRLDQETLDSITTNCPLIEKLSLFQCSGDYDSLNTSGLKRLAEVKIKFDACLKRITIDSPHLMSFKYQAAKLLQETCVIKFGGGLNNSLKNLDLQKVGLSDDWLNCTLAHLSKLESLCLVQRNEMNYVRISSDSLRSLKLHCCKKLEKIEIDAPALKFLTYRHHPELGGSCSPLQLVNRNTLSSATASFDLCRWHSAQDVDVSYEEIIQFLVNLNGFGKLKVQNNVAIILNQFKYKEGEDITEKCGGCKSLPADVEALLRRIDNGEQIRNSSRESD